MDERDLPRIEMMLKRDSLIAADSAAELIERHPGSPTARDHADKLRLAAADYAAVGELLFAMQGNWDRYGPMLRRDHQLRLAAIKPVERAEAPKADQDEGEAA